MLSFRFVLSVCVYICSAYSIHDEWHPFHDGLLNRLQRSFQNGTVVVI